jgi:hypothetical protein
MARRAQVSIDNNFKGGLLTEATGLNFPENACTETYNCIHDEKGRSKRRLGFDYENGYDTQTVDRTDSVISGFTWNNVAGDGSVSLRVVQIGSTLYFYDIAESGALSDKLLATTIDLTTYKTGTSVDPGLNECSFTSGSGYMVVTHPQLEPFYVSYDAASETATATQITVEIRDFEGLDDGYDINERPTSTLAALSAAHKYNLFNQGWYWDSNAALTAWDSAFTDMPSNADVWWLFKNTSDAFDTATVPNVFTGNAKAPRGHYILNVHDQDRTTASGIGSITSVTTSTNRLSTCAFMGGRVFYSGLAYTGFSSKIYFSQLVENADQFGYCYQANDPTSEELSDLLPTDGGVISIYGLEAVVKLFPLVNALLVFATNGIWAITGSQGVGFSPEDYAVTKISSIGAINSQSFVDVDGFPYWWNLNGIYRLTPGQQTGGFIVESITDNTIRNFYQDIPLPSRGTARGAFNYISRQVHWIYSSTEQSGPADSAEYDRVLVLNLLTNSFYPWTIGTNVKVHDVFVIKGEGGTQSFDSVTLADGDTELQSDLYGDIITTFSLSRFTIAPQFKYLCSAGDDDVAAFTFAETIDADYLDWETFDSVGQDYDSYFIIGYKLHSETQRYFQSNYVFVFLEQETSSSAFVQGLWDFTNSSDSNRWSSPQQCYNSTLTNRAVNHRRLKIRGKGRALQLKFYSETGHPFTIIGWSIWETQNTGI